MNEVDGKENSDYNNNGSASQPVLDELIDSLSMPTMKIGKRPDTGSFPSAVLDELSADMLSAYSTPCKYKLNQNSDGDGAASVTFYPSPMLSQELRGQQALPQELLSTSTQMKEFLSKLDCNAIESMSDFGRTQIVSKPDITHCFLRGCEIAFFEHFPLKISPSDIWLLILHGIAAHLAIDAQDKQQQQQQSTTEDASENASENNKNNNNAGNAQQLRSKYVTHASGSIELVVDRPQFVKGSKDNDWESVIDEFVTQMDAFTVQETIKTLDSDFSTSTNMDRIAAKVALMDICKHYFIYIVRYGCGFHEITLEGTKADWIHLKSKAASLLAHKVQPAFGEWWSKSLLPLLDRFIHVYEGGIDSIFWNSMIKRGGVVPSGGIVPRFEDVTNYRTMYSGWINVLFPYICERQRIFDDAYVKQCGFQRNRYCEAYAMSMEYANEKFETPGGGPTVNSFPCGLASAPVLFIDMSTNTQYDLKFAAGFVGVQQNADTLEISSKIGWIVAEKSKDPQKEKEQQTYKENTRVQSLQ